MHNISSKVSDIFFQNDNNLSVRKEKNNNNKIRIQVFNINQTYNIEPSFHEKLQL